MSALDKFGSITNYRIPPQSTGAAIAHRRSFWFIVSGIQFSDLKSGQSFVLQNGTEGIILSFSQLSTGDSLIEATISRNETFEVSPGTITINGSITGTLETFREVFIPASSIVDGETSTNSLSVDKIGSASVRFSAGDPYVDGFSNLKTSASRNLGSYSFFNAQAFNWLSKITEGSGSINLDTQAGVMTLDVDTSATDSAIAITDNYHKYYKGFETLALISGFSGDSGKTDVVRRWGIFDESDGIYFEQDGIDLYAVLRSSVDGTVQEVRVHRNDWNGDRVDGSENIYNRSGFELNLVNNNLYTIAYSWLGSGSASVGLQGAFIGDLKLHTFEESANQSPNAFMKNPDLPLRFEIFNKNTTSSPSRYSLICASVESNTNILDDSEDNESIISTWTIPATKQINDTSSTFIASARLSNIAPDGTKNRRKLIPISFSLNNPTDTGILLDVSLGGTGDNEIWNALPSPRNSLETDVNSTTVTGNEVIQTYMLEPGINNIEVRDIFSSKGQYLSVSGDNFPSQMITFNARLLEGGSNPTTGNVLLSFNWMEV